MKHPKSPRLTMAGARKFPKLDSMGNPIMQAYYKWTAWSAVVQVMKRGRKFYVTPPGGVEIQVTARTAGEFIPTERSER